MNAVLSIVVNRSKYDRFGFQIHGDNNKRDKSASEGCIVTNKRDDFKKGDRPHVTSGNDNDGTSVLS
jgi:hypothetical protein